MAKGDLFKRSLEAGTSFLDMTRERAEALVKEWVDAGDLGKARAQKAVEQVLDRSRKASDELRAMVRKEIGIQLAALGVATRDDIARLEGKIAAATGSAAPGVADAPASPRTGASTAAAASTAKTGGRAKKPGAPAPAKKVTAKKVTTKKVTTKKAASAGGPARKAGSTGAGQSATAALPAKKAAAPRKAPRPTPPGPGAGSRPGT
jgi:polyhydroxyalkanoate synthesis regulator phasin